MNGNTMLTDVISHYTTYPNIRSRYSTQYIGSTHHPNMVDPNS